MTPDPAPPDYRLLLRPLPGHDAPPTVRLRKLLKIALRSLGLRCLAATEVPRAAKPAPAARS